MSKSYGNDIKLADSKEDTAKKLKKMITDPKKIYKGDPGRPEICPVFALHEIYTGDTSEIREKCKSGELGCVECKKILTKNLNSSLDNLRIKRKELENDPGYVLNILKKGASEAREKALATMSDVRKAMNLERAYA
jgi:tryptophanyl-tRNA synthetase